MITTAVILAAGQGTRMHSALPKVLHRVAGQPMALHSLNVAAQVTETRPVMIIGHGAEGVREIVGDRAQFAHQEQRLGTGHAVMQAEPLLRGKADYIFVISADMPLLQSQTLQNLVKSQKTHPGPLTILTVMADNPRGFGRIVRDSRGHVQAIVEEADATPEQLAIRELNAGIYCFAADWAWDALRKIPLSAKGEYYLTDLVGIAVAEKLSVQALIMENPAEAIGVNTRIHLSEAEAIMRKRINQAWMMKGVTMIDPSTTYIEVEASIGTDTIIWPNTSLRGNTRVGEKCQIGPNVTLQDATVGDRCVISSSIIERAKIKANTTVGPYTHIRNNMPDKMMPISPSEAATKKS